MSVATLKPTAAWKEIESGRGTAATLRRELWRAVVQALNSSGIPYCLLGSSEDAGERAGCDMDFAVRPQDEPKVPQLLASAAASRGAHLVQAIRHEISATYFAIARQQGSEVAVLNPDCATDYRRRRRLWIRADELLAEHSFGGGFCRPTREREFQYYLLKHVLKQSAGKRQWQKLLELHGGANRCAAMTGFWSEATLRQIDLALLRRDHRWFEEQLPRLLRELEASPFLESFSGRAKASTTDAARAIERILHPTGVLVAVNGGDRQQREEMARLLANQLAPAFRRRLVCDRLSPLTVLPSLIRSTVVVYTGDSFPLLGWAGALRVTYDTNLSLQKNTASAVGALIVHLERRTFRRLKLQVPET